MKQMGRKHRSYFRICATDLAPPRDGRVIEELGSYDPMIPLTDARCTLNNERVQVLAGRRRQALGSRERADQEVRPGRHAFEGATKRRLRS